MKICPDHPDAYPARGLFVTEATWHCPVCQRTDLVPDSLEQVLVGRAEVWEREGGPLPDELAIAPSWQRPLARDVWRSFNIQAIPDTLWGMRVVVDPAVPADPGFQVRGRSELLPAERRGAEDFGPYGH